MRRGACRGKKLLEARNHYIDWQEFYLWVRLILEFEDHLPAWLRDIVNERCPGFLEKRGRSARGPARTDLSIFVWKTGSKTTSSAL
jgi:hypothetical protein